MPIWIWRYGDRYTAKVTRPDADVEWATPQAMSAQELYNALQKVGCDPVDIMDALFECDPGWVQRAPGFKT